MQQKLVDSALEGVLLQERYIVEKRFTQGGMAWIYEATDLQSQSQVALKILFSRWMHDERTLKRFVQEVEIHRELKHPHIVRVDGLIEEGGVIGMAMEWVEGGDLKQLLESRQDPMSIQEIREIFLPMVDAMAYAHSQNVVHRDLKPGNVLLSRVGEQWFPKLTDFGIAKRLKAKGVTFTGAKLGTLQYMAPEQWSDSKNVDHQADIYSLGVVLYRMLTGELPFSGDYETLISKLLEESAPYPKDVPAPLAGIVLRCLEKDPKERYASCELFLKVLKQFLSHDESPARTEAPNPGPPARETLAYVPAFSMDLLENTSKDDHASVETPQQVQETASSAVSEMPFLDHGQSASAIPDPLANTPSQAPHLSSVSDFRRTVVWGVDDGLFDLDGEYDKALELAAAAQEKEKNAQLMTAAIDVDDPAFVRIQSLVEREAGSQDHLSQASVLSQRTSFRPIPFWVFWVGALLLLLFGVFLGWLVARSG